MPLIVPTCVRVSAFAVFSLEAAVLWSSVMIYDRIGDAQAITAHLWRALEVAACSGGDIVFNRFLLNLCSHLARCGKSEALELCLHYQQGAERQEKVRSATAPL